MTAAELAALVGGRLAGPDAEFDGVAPLATAGPQQCAFSTGAIGDSRAGVILARVPSPGRTVVVVEDPRRAFVTLLERLFPVEHEPGVHAAAIVHPTARLGSDVAIHAGAVIGARCVVGARTVLHPNVVLYADTVVGSDCVIHAGSVIGADGFAYLEGEDVPVKVPQLGRVRIEDHVEIGANTCVDRAALGETVIGRGSKLDNLVQVGHNARVGRSARIAGQTGLAGSVVVGDRSVLAGQVGIADHVNLGPGTVVGGQSGVHASVEGGSWLGTPALPAGQARRLAAILRRLPTIWKKMPDVDT